MLVDHLLNILKEFNKFRETANLKHLHRNELEKACFAHDAAYSDSKDLVKKNYSRQVFKRWSL